MPTLTTTQFPAAATPTENTVFGLVAAPGGGRGSHGLPADGAHRPCLAVRPVRRVSRRPGRPRVSVRNHWSSRAGGGWPLARGAGGGVWVGNASPGRLPRGGRRWLVCGRRVDG